MCKKEDIDYYHSISSVLTSDGKEFLCHDYEYGSPKCNTFMRRLPPLDGTEKRPTTWFSLVLGLLNSFLDD